MYAFNVMAGLKWLFSFSIGFRQTFFSPKILSVADSVSSELNGRSGVSPSEEGNSSGEWPGVKQIVDTEPLIAPVKFTSQV